MAACAACAVLGGVIGLMTAPGRIRTAGDQKTA